MITEPSFKRPLASASSIMALPTRSFTLPAGLKYSNFRRSLAFNPSFFSRFTASTRGVFPTSSVIPLKIPAINVTLSSQEAETHLPPAFQPEVLSFIHTVLLGLVGL